ncbi:MULTISPECIES: aldehyde dehydrogenase (NADP(+)) [Photorhabdus]|uniref:NADP-dependent aldehyde dehydrogenase n=2 Tax=Photorhabdus asymbiotica TaxID=291112 RepID=A0ABX9SQW7_9GAMM|nr:aldehyde dehydrogenase (NADP(+)) [Photorhabdus asymbiotica]RKS65870.1 NADP-dependent aldehyde dehydrogenase [Photorhabdus asymbiotica]CAQ84245.1 probable aldehyde dehydrogenase [Photorhabdus asymbiotica]
MLVTHSGMQFIGGRRQAEGERCLHSQRAEDNSPMGYAFYQATVREVELAAQAAGNAFTCYSQTSLAERAAFLDKIADEIDALGDDFIALVSAETALPPARLQGEQSRTSGQMRLFATLLRRGDVHAARIDTAQPERKPLSRVDIRQCHIPLGPVAVFGASNFPLAFSTAGGDTASALAAGCSVVFKAHSGHMATAEIIAEAIERAITATQMPLGVFNMIYGNNVGADLVKHPIIQAVGFTGSLAGGRALFDMAMQRPQPIPFFAEMSSINPVIVLPNALTQRGKQIAQELVNSFTLGCGQFCTKPGMILGIRSPEFTQFMAQLGQEITLRPAQSMLNRGTLLSYQKGIHQLDNEPLMRRLAIGKHHENQASAMLYYADIALLLNKNTLLQEEVFGPVAIVIEAVNQHQLLHAIDCLPGQLTATLIGEHDELANAHELSRRLQNIAGRVVINGYPTGVEVGDAMVHGGPYPATSDARGTSVGTLAIWRFLRPVCFQNYPESLLPPALQNRNPLNISRLINGGMSREAL